MQTEMQEKRKKLIKRIILVASIVGFFIALFIPSLTAHGQIPDIDVCGTFGCANDVSQFANTSTQDSIAIIIIRIVYFLIFIGVAIATFFVVWGGFKMVTSSGDAKNYKEGMDTFTSAIIGMVIMILSVSVVYVVTELVFGLDILSSNPGTAATSNNNASFFNSNTGNNSTNNSRSNSGNNNSGQTINTTLPAGQSGTPAQNSVSNTRNNCIANGNFWVESPTQGRCITNTTPCPPGYVRAESTCRLRE